MLIDNKIVKSTSDVYQKIGDELNVPYRNVYLAARRYTNASSENNRDETSEAVCEEESKTEPDECTEYTLFDPKFKVSPDDKMYEIDIKNIGLFNYNENEMKLQSEWSDTLNEIIWNFSRCPCAWTFTKHRHVANEKVVFGSCRSTECNASLFAYTENNKSKLKIVIKNFNSEAKHIEKRYVKGANKNKVVALLKLNSAAFVHAELSNEILQSCDFDAAHLPKQATLRKIMQRANDQTYRDMDPIRSLCLLKTESFFHKSITDIGVDPFYCIFFTPEQKEWLRLATRSKRCVISIDSTGTITC